MKHRQPPYRNDPKWIAEWKDFTNRYIGLLIPTDRILTRHRQTRPNCIQCWDTGLCPDCYGEHTQYCPTPNCAGYCACAAGRARRAAYDKSLKDYGLA
jgi:hypothetical protein